MTKTFSIRIDLESDKGIRKGLPRILGLLKKHGIKASFYLVMGGEANPIELAKYRGEMKSSGTRKIKIFSFIEKLRMVALPRDFVSVNRELLKKILEEGHELGIHGWKHRIWTRGTNVDVDKQISLAVKRYEKIFGRKPLSFAAPAFRTNEKVVEILEKKGIKVISDISGEKPSVIQPTKIVNVPITITGELKTPIIEYLASQGKSDSEILEILKKKVKDKPLATMYCHGLYECIQKIPLLDQLFIFLNKEGIKVKKIDEIAKTK